MEFTQLDNDGKPVPDHPTIDLEIVSVDHMGVKLFMFMQRMEGSEPKFARLLTPPPEKTPDNYLDAVMDYMENTLGFGNILALDVLDAARVRQREHAEREKAANEEGGAA